MFNHKFFLAAFGILAFPLVSSAIESAILTRAPVAAPTSTMVKATPVVGFTLPPLPAETPIVFQPIAQPLPVATQSPVKAVNPISIINPPTPVTTPIVKLPILPTAPIAPITGPISVGKTPLQPVSTMVKALPVTTSGLQTAPAPAPTPTSTSIFNTIITAVLHPLTSSTPIPVATSGLMKVIDPISIVNPTPITAPIAKSPTLPIATPITGPVTIGKTVTQPVSTLVKTTSLSPAPVATSTLVKAINTTGGASTVSSGGSSTQVSSTATSSINCVPVQTGQFVSNAVKGLAAYSLTNHCTGNGQDYQSTSTVFSQNGKIAFNARFNLPVASPSPAASLTPAQVATLVAAPSLTCTKLSSSSRSYASISSLTSSTYSYHCIGLGKNYVSTTTSYLKNGKLLFSTRGSAKADFTASTTPQPVATSTLVKVVTPSPKPISQPAPVATSNMVKAVGVVTPAPVATSTLSKIIGTILSPFTSASPSPAPKPIVVAPVAPIAPAAPIAPIAKTTPISQPASVPTSTLRTVVDPVSITSNPAPVAPGVNAVNPSGVTTIAVTQPSATSGMGITQPTFISGYPTISYLLNVSQAGSYQLVLSASSMNATTGMNIVVNGQSAGNLLFPQNTATPNTSTTTPLLLNLPQGKVTLALNSPSSGEPWQVSGMTLTPYASSTNSLANIVNPSGLTSVNIAKPSASTAVSDISSAYVGGFQNGGTISYLLQVSEAGPYQLTLGASSWVANVNASVMINGNPAGSVWFPQSTGYYDYSTTPPLTLNLPAGAVSLTINAEPWTSFNMNAISLMPEFPVPLPVVNPLATLVNPIGPTSVAIAKPSASNAVNYINSTFIGGFQNGGSISYLLEVSKAGPYQLTLGASSWVNNVSVLVATNGQPAGAIPLQNTNGYYNYATSQPLNLNLPQGETTLSLMNQPFTTFSMNAINLNPEFPPGLPGPLPISNPLQPILQQPIPGAQ